MANIKVVFIQSVSFNRVNGKAGISYAPTYVYDLTDTVATDYINKKWAIPFVGWETNPLRPPMIRFPQ
ncbi:hypothetical protein [Peribacillus simplex]|uniref:hypothetical protein n=1 Tax=Peribacillus simplex TaxID=1478 RepID=UPI0024C11729|nr:hypothetical protein [Peribacillus simplex]WHX92014.1 hypothetical protein QNH50_03790 [Peribacillus simplex]